ncbi:M16 family metallopeptidase [Pedobacter sp. PWIIR3]
MKKYLISCVFIALACTAAAQIPAVSFDVNGLKVIFRPTQKETVSIAMYFRGGVMNYKPEQAGIENLALATATTCGTKNYKVYDYQELADEYGIDITGASTTDYGVISMDCISKYLNQGWKLFSDAIVNPAFDATEFSNQKERIISVTHAREASPEAMVDQMTFTTMFKNTRYAVLPFGSESTLRNLSPDSARNYYFNTLLNKNRMFLVVAGKISREELEQKIKQAFASIPSRPYTLPVYNDVPLKGDRLVTMQRNIATNYISRVMNAPSMSNPDYPAFRLAVSVLSSYLHYKLRTEQALSYAPGATVKLLQLPYTSLYVSTTQPKKSIQGMMEAFNDIKQGNYNTNVLKDIKKSYKLDNYNDQESAVSIVNNLGKAEILGDYKLEENLLDKISAVDAAEVNRVFTKYLTGAIWVYLGDEQLGKDAFK